MWCFTHYIFHHSVVLPHRCTRLNMLLWWPVIWSEHNVTMAHFPFKSSLETEHTFPRKYICVYNQCFTYFWIGCAFKRAKITMRCYLQSSQWNIPGKYHWEGFNYCSQSIYQNVELIDPEKQTVHLKNNTHVSSFVLICCGLVLIRLLHTFMDDFVYTPSQWEMTLKYDVVSNCLGACTKWLLYLQDCFTGTKAISRLPRCLWKSILGEIGK